MSFRIDADRVIMPEIGDDSSGDAPNRRFLPEDNRDVFGEGSTHVPKMVLDVPSPPGILRKSSDPLPAEKQVVFDIDSQASTIKESAKKPKRIRSNNNKNFDVKLRKRDPFDINLAKLSGAMNKFEQFEFGAAADPSDPGPVSRHDLKIATSAYDRLQELVNKLPKEERGQFQVRLDAIKLRQNERIPPREALRRLGMEMNALDSRVVAESKKIVGEKQRGRVYSPDEETLQEIENECNRLMDVYHSQRSKLSDDNGDLSQINMELDRVSTRLAEVNKWLDAYLEADESDSDSETE